MRPYIYILPFFLFCLSANAQIKVDSVNVIEGSQTPQSTLTGDEIWNYLQGAPGSRVWKRMTSQELKDYMLSGSDEPSLEQFLNHSGSTITVNGTLPTTNLNRTIRVTRGGVELIYNEDYTLSGNVFNFINPLDGEHVKIWYENQ